MNYRSTALKKRENERRNKITGISKQHDRTKNKQRKECNQKIKNVRSTNINRSNNNKTKKIRKMSGIGVIGSQVVGTGMGMLQGKYNDDRQLDQQKALGLQQMSQQVELNRRNQEMALDYWDKTGAEAQRKQYEKAGLNVGLMYGGSGAGGSTMSQGGSIGGAMAPAGGGEIQAATGMALQANAQLELLQAQKENIQADTANKKADAGYTGGAKTDNTKEDTAVKFQDSQIKNLERQQKVETFESDVAKAKTEAIGASISNDLMKSGIKIQEAQINKMTQDIAQGWKNLDRQEKEMRIKKFEAELKAAYPTINQVWGGKIDQLIRDFDEAIGWEGDNHKKVDK